MQGRLRFFSFLLGLAGALSLFVYLFPTIVGFLIASIVLATILKPLVNLISHKQIFNITIPREVAVVIGYVALIGLLASFAALLIPLIEEQVTQVGNLNLSQVLKSIRKPLMELENFLIENHLVKEGRGFLRRGINQLALFEQGEFNLGEWVGNIIGFTSNLFISTLAVLFMSFFFINEQGILRRFFIKAIPNAYFEMVVSAFYKIEKHLSFYLLGLLVQVFSIFLMTAIGLTILGIPYALTVATFAGLITVIPYIGPSAGGVLAIVVGLTTAPDNYGLHEYVLLLSKILAVTLIIHAIDNFITQPLIFSKSVKAHPLEIFVVIFAGAALAHVVGMILAIPVYTVLRVSIQELLKGLVNYRRLRVQFDKNDLLRP